jgi:hypothetical protein
MEFGTQAPKLFLQTVQTLVQIFRRRGRSGRVVGPGAAEGFLCQFLGVPCRLLCAALGILEVPAHLLEVFLGIPKLSMHVGRVLPGLIHPPHTEMRHPLGHAFLHPKRLPRARSRIGCVLFVLAHDDFHDAFLSLPKQGKTHLVPGFLRACKRPELSGIRQELVVETQ